MFGLRNDCELVYAWIGAFCGLFAGLSLMMMNMPLAPLNTADGWRVALLLGPCGLLVVVAIFCIFYRQPFFALLSSTLIGALIVGVVVYAIATLFASGTAQPAVLFLIGALLGQLFGRLVCARCENLEIRPDLPKQG